MRRTGTARGRSADAVRGFTLLELMITVAIVAILAGVAYPSYIAYITRARVVEATATLSDFRVKMEQFFQDNRTYAGAFPNGCGVNDLAGKYFDLNCSAATAAGYTLNANGKGSLAGVQYRLVVDNATGLTRSTQTPPTGWSTPVPNNCWAIRADGSCA